MEKKRKIQISAGEGPIECCWYVGRALKYLRKALTKSEFDCIVVECVDAAAKDCFQSVVVETDATMTFLEDWIGTVLFIGKSRFRPFHKRKNWYISIQLLEEVSFARFDEKDVVFQTMRSSGPGGQNVNKVNTAVRAIHPPTGIQVLANDARTQLENKKNAIVRLKEKVLTQQSKMADVKDQENWMNHRQLERGNPIKIFNE